QQRIPTYGPGERISLSTAPFTGQKPPDVCCNHDRSHEDGPAENEPERAHSARADAVSKIATRPQDRHRQNETEIDGGTLQEQPHSTPANHQESTVGSVY